MNNTVLCFAILACFAVPFIDAVSADEENSSGVTCPPFVGKLALEYTRSQEVDAKAKSSIADCYTQGFFRGYTGHSEFGPLKPEHSKLVGKTQVSILNAYDSGIRSGRKHRENFPESRESIFTGFGYKLVKLAGVWTTGFETSCFRPVDKKVATGCIWLTAERAASINVSWTPTPIPEKFRKHIKLGSVKHANVVVAGYISNPGKFGHLNSYEHQIFAISIKPIDPKNTDG
ncbi:hypothetical protein LF1_55140 [Rubripirellula obstinata]|uniref:SCP domain-containing protein n=1 Tax=Rubripirellula obstinata TaxID=406547 RepID=A0A5B1CCP2_9BACT|nr:hypothetical protein [Rubripirellula obstinata]KAA1257114.1 hypothetical protein LF1_55140 [Rubripirellula obstinata]